MTLPLRALANAYAGQTLYVVGKGPSLVHLTPDYFGAGPVLTLNSAIRKVRTLGLPNPLLVMQKDGKYPKSCAQPCRYLGPHMTAPVDGEAVLVSATTSPNCYASHVPRYVFDEAALGLEWFAPSAVVSIKIAELLGCRRLVFLCLDAAVNGDNRVVLDGLEMVRTHRPGMKHPASYEGSARWMREVLDRTPFESVSWILPEPSGARV